MLEILAVERFAARLDRGGEDQRVINVEIVAPGERDGEFVRRQRDRPYVIYERPEVGQRRLDDRPIEAKFLAGDPHELVENLGADDAAIAESAPGDIAARIVRNRINEDISVEERRHRSLASSRSNL